jgi:hypothetical protein
MAKGKITCSFQLNEKDFLNFNYAVNRRPLRFMLLYGFILMALVIGFEAVKEKINVIPIMIGLFIIILSFGVTLFNMVRKSREGWAVNTAFHDPMMFAFDDKGFSCTTPKHSARVTWQKVTKVVWGKKIIVIMTGGTQAYLIPTRIENINEVKKVIWEYVSHKK